MRTYLMKRFIAMLITIFIIATVTFFLMHAIPGGPFDLMGLTDTVPRETVEAMNARYHLDDPVIVQYGNYLKDLLKGNLGISYRSAGTTVNEIIGRGFPFSAKIGLVASLVIVIAGIGLGMVAGLYRGKLPERLVTLLTTICMSVPGFVVAAFLLYVFCEKLGVLPSNGLSTWKHYIGPVVAISLFSLAFVIRLMASNLSQTMNQDYIRTARANGLPPSRIIWKHAMRNALIPVVTYIGPTVGAILTGSFAVEKVFSIPGMGEYFVSSISNRDYTVLMGVTLFYAIIIIVTMFLVDMVYLLIDPRIKLKE